LAEGLGIPLIAISRLELLARKAPETNAIVALDAGRGDYFAGVYRSGVREREVLLNRHQLAAVIADAGVPVLICEERVRADIADLGGVEMVAAPTAVDVLKLARERFQAQLFDDAETLDGNYLRRSDAEMLAKLAEHTAARMARRNHQLDRLLTAPDAVPSPAEFTARLKP
jgi:tRNA threonylcarbamoyladenosine biosynthesis protein TsaB